jgi:hypothetical protein
MFARFIVNRRWMVAAGAAAILALVIGTVVGRAIIPSKSEVQRTKTAPEQQTTFTDSASGISLRYPAGWARLDSRDAQVHLVAAASPETSLSLRVSRSDLADVTPRTLPIVRQFSDGLIGADQRATMLSDPEPVTLGGIAGWRYRYTYPSKDGTPAAHVHYFLFKHKQLVQLVFQSVPASGLAAAEPTFNGIAASLRSRGR